jgi:hypothetical protein
MFLLADGTAEGDDIFAQTDEQVASDKLPNGARDIGAAASPVPSSRLKPPRSQYEALVARGISNFDYEFRTSCISASSNEVTYATYFPFPPNSQNIYSPDRAFMPSRPPDSANSTFSSLVDYSNCTTAPSACQDSSGFPLPN